MYKTIVAWILACALTITLVPDNLSIKADENMLQINELRTYYQKEKGEASATGYQAYIWVDENEHPIDEKELVNKRESTAFMVDPIVETENFPSSYDMRNVDGENYLPAIRNQGGFGTCWAHAALVAMESNMIKKGYADTDVDYAERHLAYFAHTQDENTGDGTEMSSALYGKYGGGNAQQATAALVSWYGAAKEEDFPYTECSRNDVIDESYRKESVAHVTGSYNLTKPSDIKKAVMENGAVQGSYFSEYSDGEYVYKTGTTETNHAISIIGWDDNMDKSHFENNGNIPSENGAWLCRNSWGTYWGNEGYFWLSYEDSSLDFFWTFVAEPATFHDYLYQYDGAGYNMAVQGCDTAANAYTAVSDQILRQVGFYTMQEDEYEVKIYLGEEKTYRQGRKSYYTFPNSPVTTVSGQVEYGGYHTIDLEEDIWLSKGQRFLVSVKLDSGCWLMEGGSNYYAGENESYLLYATTRNKELWLDCTDYSDQYKNVCIKAIADEASILIAKELEETEMMMSFSAEEIPTQEVLESKLPETVSVITNIETEEKAEVSVRWETENTFSVTGGVYTYIGTLQSNEEVQIPKNFAPILLIVTVEPVITEEPEETQNPDTPENPEASINPDTPEESGGKAPSGESILPEKVEQSNEAGETDSIQGKEEIWKSFSVGEILKVGNESYKITQSDTHNATAEYVGTTSKAKSIKIPATVTINGVSYKVTAIAANAFKNNKKITSVVIGATIKSIGTKAFYGCNKLKTIIIGRSVTSLGKEAFKNCNKLAKIQVKSVKMKSVGKNALKGIKASAQIIVPKKKFLSYKKLFKGKGQNKSVKIKK